MLPSIVNVTPARSDVFPVTLAARLTVLPETVDPFVGAVTFTTWLLEGMLSTVTFMGELVTSIANIKCNSS